MKCPYCKKQIKCKKKIDGICKDDKEKCPFEEFEEDTCMLHKY